MSYLRRREAQETRELFQKQAVFENATHAIKVSESEKEELQDVLLSCAEDIRLWVAPLLDVPAAQHILSALLKEEKEQVNAESDKHTSVLTERFERRLREDDQVKDQLNEALDVLEDTASKIRAAYSSIQQTTETVPTLEDVREDVQNRAKRTWKDLPSDELAERLSKGEIMPRDEWIPGQGRERRTLRGPEVEAHLAFGKRLHTEGNEAFRNNQLELALTRYTQGAQLLNWVEGETAEITGRINDLLLVFLKNQAAASLLLGEYRITEEATTCALKLDPHDSKALYRRAEAFVCLGNLPAAKDDYMAIIKSPYSDSAAILAARQGIRRIRSVVSKWKSDVRRLVTSATEDVVFSFDRLPSTGETSNIASAKPLVHRNPASPTEPIRQYKPSWERFIRVFGSPDSITLAESTPNVSVLPDEKTYILLEDILECYTSDTTQQQLNDLRRDADFDELRILVRFKHLIPSLLEPILQQWTDIGDTITERHTVLLRSVGYWYNRYHAEIRSIVEEIYQNVLGDCSDD